MNWVTAEEGFAGTTWKNAVVDAWNRVKIIKDILTTIIMHTYKGRHHRKLSTFETLWRFSLAFFQLDNDLFCWFVFSTFFKVGYAMWIKQPQFVAWKVNSCVKPCDAKSAPSVRFISYGCDSDDNKYDIKSRHVKTLLEEGKNDTHYFAVDSKWYQRYRKVLSDKFADKQVTIITFVWKRVFWETIKLTVISKL